MDSQITLLALTAAVIITIRNILIYVMEERSKRGITPHTNKNRKIADVLHIFGRIRNTGSISGSQTGRNTSVQDSPQEECGETERETDNAADTERAEDRF